MLSNQKKKIYILFENPYDIETVLESIKIAERHGKEILFLDRLFTNIRLDPNVDLTTASFRTLKELEILKNEGIYNGKSKII
jgi:hypothetical protein